MVEMLKCAWRLFVGMRYHEHREAVKLLRDIERRKDACYIIHYSCESFFGATSGLSPRVTSIAVGSFATGQIRSFSIHLSAEIKGVKLTDIADNYDDLERDMLSDYFDYMRNIQNAVFLHWNMRNVTFGFQAIEQRGRILCPDKVFSVVDSLKYDLASLLQMKYGDKYIDNPHLYKIVEKNNCASKGFLSGADEAEAFVNREFVKMHQSTLAKVATLAKVVRLTIDNELKTNATWRDKYGLSVAGVHAAAKEQWWWEFFMILVGSVLNLIIDNILSWFGGG